MLNQVLLFRRSFPWANLFKLSRLSKSTVFEKYLGKNGPSKIYGSQHFKNLKLFKGCLPQILLGLFLNTLFHLLFWIISIHSKMCVLEAIRKFFSATKNSFQIIMCNYIQAITVLLFNCYCTRNFISFSPSKHLLIFKTKHLDIHKWPKNAWTLVR